MNQTTGFNFVVNPLDEMSTYTITQPFKIPVNCVQKSLRASNLEKILSKHFTDFVIFVENMPDQM